MYREFYGMKHQPFSRNVPSEALYESKAMTEALGRLAYVADRQLFAVVTADAGCGKSTLIRKFASSLPKEKYIFLYLSDSKLTPRWCYKGMLDQLGLKDSCKKRSRSYVEFMNNAWYVCWMKHIC